MDLKQAKFVIYSSPDQQNWAPVLPEDVPEWVKEPETLGRMMLGEMCMKRDEGDRGSLWYRADAFLNVWERDRVAQALRARERAEADELLRLPADQPCIIIEENLTN